jgi:hypothetical protein
MAGVYLMQRQLTPLTDALKKSREVAARVSQQFKAAAESRLDGCFIMATVRDERNEKPSRRSCGAAQKTRS